MANIRTIGQRQRLAHQGKPHWHPIDGLRGAALGFRKHKARGLQGGGAWVLRYRVDGKYLEHGFAEADNSKMPANGSVVLNFEQAVNRARMLYSELTSQEAIDGRFEPYTVRRCAREYVNELEESGGGWKAAMQTMDAFVTPELGDVLVEDLKAEVIVGWMRAIAKRKPRARSALNGRRRRYQKVDTTDPDYRRRRAATANRIWTSFRAALNLAYRRGRFQSNEFTKVSPLRVGKQTVNKPHCRPILPEEMDALLEAVKLEGPDFEALVLVALYSGCRYGELGRLTVGDWDSKSKTLYVAPGKTGRDRDVDVTSEGAAFLNRLTENRQKAATLLTNDGTPWLKSQQSRPWRRAVTRAKIQDAPFKSTRDTFGTWLLNSGCRLKYVSEQLGHASIAMTERHYVRMLANLRVEERAKAERIRIVGHAEIVPLRAKKSSKRRESA